MRNNSVRRVFPPYVTSFSAQTWARYVPKKFKVIRANEKIVEKYFTEDDQLLKLTENLNVWNEDRILSDATLGYFTLTWQTISVFLETQTRNDSAALSF